MQSIPVSYYCREKLAVECSCDERPDVAVETRQELMNT
jgi:hypothetical protein